jgi:hypothetical protein
VAWSECGIVGPLPAGRVLGRWENEDRAEDPNDDIVQGQEVKPHRHEVGTRATGEAGSVWPNEVWWNHLGYLYRGVVGHLSDVP